MSEKKQQTETATDLEVALTINEQLKSEKATLQKQLDDLTAELFEVKEDYAKAATTSANSAMPEHSQILVKGSTFRLADELITLEQDTVVSFSGSHAETKFAAMLAMSDNLTPENRANLKFKYDGLGRVLPVIEHVDDEDEVMNFIAGLSREDAHTFNVLQTWEELERETKRLEKEAAKKAKK